MQKHKHHEAGVIFTVGFTVFATFFGAGNLIFPPALGLSSGQNWFWAFLAYFIMDAGLGAITLIAAAKFSGGFAEMSEKLGLAGNVLILADAICLGPMACVPRTAAVTYELAVSPLAPSVSGWIVSAAFFILTALLCIRPSKIVDIVGTVLSPVLFVTLLALIAVGIARPAAPIENAVPIAQAIKEGLLAGYQTMDMLVASLLASVLFVSTAYLQLDRKQEVGLFTKASGVACVGLFAVYGGLAYLGTVSGAQEGMSNAELLLFVVRKAWGEPGIALLAVIVTLACLTTAISLVSACANAVCRILKDKIPYKAMVIVMCAVSCVIANFGISTIIAIASPVLELIYPAAICLVVLSFLPGRLSSPRTARFASGAAVLVSAYVQLDALLPAQLYSSALPLAGFDLAWLPPAVLAAAVGCLTTQKEKIRG